MQSFVNFLMVSCGLFSEGKIYGTCIGLIDMKFKTLKMLTINLTEHVSVSIGKLCNDIRQATVAVSLSEYSTRPVGQILAAWFGVVVLWITLD